MIVGHIPLYEHDWVVCVLPRPTSCILRSDHLNTMIFAIDAVVQAHHVQLAVCEEWLYKYDYPILGDSFAAVSTEGLLIYSMDSGAMFTPHDLTVDVTPEAVLAARRDKDHLLSIVLSFRLNDNLLVRESLEAVPVTDGVYTVIMMCIVL